MQQEYMPCSIEAERAVLGVILINGNLIGTVAERLKPEEFYDPYNRKLYELLMDMYDAGKTVDFVTVMVEMKNRGLYESLGGQSFLAELTVNIPITVVLNYYIDIVKDKAAHRRLIEVGRTISEMAGNDAKTSEEIATEAENLFYQAYQKNDISTPLSAKDLSAQVLGDIATIQASGGRQITGYSSGFRDLDRIILGFQPGSFNVIAARPSMGKTALALNIAQFGGRQEDNPTVLIFSLEMSKEQVMQRMFSAASGVRLSAMMTGLLSDQDVDSLKIVASDLSQRNIYIAECSSLTATEFRAKCRSFKSKHPDLALIVVDYLQLMQSDHRRHDNRQQETADISRMLKTVAIELGSPVVALSQLSRDVEKRNEKKPQLSDLRDSGAIEQDADTVILLYREDYYADDQGDKLYQKQYSKAELRVAKNRNGQTGMCSLTFQREYTRFVGYVEDV